MTDKQYYGIEKHLNTIKNHELLLNEVLEKIQRV